MRLQPNLQVPSILRVSSTTTTSTTSPSFPMIQAHASATISRATSLGRSWFKESPTSPSPVQDCILGSTLMTKQLVSMLKIVNSDSLTIKAITVAFTSGIWLPSVPLR